MRRYMTGIVTGAMMGAVVAGMWLLKRPGRSTFYRTAIRQARRVAPRMVRFAKTGSRRVVHLAKRRLG
ncbi:MAG: hypothetical protein M0Z53_08070 [Thermaerobacter sp.]|nr:hypothetical protein [Thermaerobacter sp.]